MSNTDSGGVLPVRRRMSPGLLERAVTRLLMRPARIFAVRDLSPHFRLIDFEGTALKDCPWEPGDKIQIKLGAGLLTRTYTPIHWNRSAGATRILAYIHGSGPGSDWAQRAAPGDTRQILGPRRSLHLSGSVPTLVFFGDETSFGAAAALRERTPDRTELHFVFEVTRLADAAVLKELGLVSARVIARRPGDTHLKEAEESILPLLGASGAAVLSGNASSIRYLHRALRQSGVPARRVTAKVYWAAGRSGLD